SGGGDRTVPARVQAGEGAHSRQPSPRPRHPLPPPQAGEGWGGGQSVASEPAPIPAFPRKRGKGRTVVTPRPARGTRSLPRKRGWGGGSPPLRIHSMDPSRSAGSGSQRLHDSPGRLRPPVHGPRLRRPREGGNIEWHRRATRGVACVVVSATACAGPQSALDPAGPAAGAIAQGWWLMATGALVAWLLVLALTAL